MVSTSRPRLKDPSYIAASAFPSNWAYYFEGKWKNQMLLAFSLELELEKQERAHELA